VQVSALRLALLTGAATAASFALFYLWLRSPLVLALLGAALFGTVFMMVGASLGDDPVAADEAWRLEAGDLGRDDATVTVPATATSAPAVEAPSPAGGVGESGGPTSGPGADGPR
jgi:hypothetical protein